MASAVDSRLAYARLSAVATASRLPTATRGSNNSYTTSWDTTEVAFPFLLNMPAIAGRSLIANGMLKSYGGGWGITLWPFSMAILLEQSAMHASSTQIRAAPQCRRLTLWWSTNHLGCPDVVQTSTSGVSALTTWIGRSILIFCPYGKSERLLSGPQARSSIFRLGERFLGRAAFKRRMRRAR